MAPDNINLFAELLLYWGPWVCLLAVLIWGIVSRQTQSSRQNAANYKVISLLAEIKPCSKTGNPDVHPRHQKKPRHPPKHPHERPNRLT